MITTDTRYITLDDHGIAWIEGANIKVSEVAIDATSLGLSPAEIHFQHPILSLAQVHAALAYYFDHRDVIDAEVLDRERRADALRASTSASNLVRRLSDEGKLA